jgi:cytoskeletal protein RodZ
MAGLGATLRKARLERGLSLQEVEATTKVRSKYLQALEEEDFDQLPPPVYARGFLRSYIRFLELDEEELLQLYPHEAKPPVSPLAPPPRFRPRVTMIFVVAMLALLGACGAILLIQRQPEDERRGVVIELPTVTPTSESTMVPVPETITPTATVLSTASPTQEAGEATPEPTSTSSPTPTATPEEVDVPAVVGMPFSEAKAALDEAGLEANRHNVWNEEVEIGTVISQNPSAGESIAEGSSVNLTVSKGPKRIVVPNVKGLPEQEAKNVLLLAGLEVSPWINYHGHDQFSDDDLNWACVGCVLSITPDEGTEVEPGTEVSLAVRGD